MAFMQGAPMTEEYRRAAELLAKEYKQELAQALAEEKEALAEAASKKKVSKDKLEANRVIPVMDGTIVKLVNCSGDPDKARLATAQLVSAGFQVIDGGEDDKIRKTVVISTTNDGAIISRLDQVPFKHKMKIKRNGKQEYHGLILLGKNFK